MWWVVANEIHYTVNSLTYGYGCGKDRSLILIRYLPKHKSLLVCCVYCHGYVGLTAKGYVLASNNEIGWSFVVINVKMLGSIEYKIKRGVTTYQFAAAI